jgi:two-component system phosphate regulon response regulator OmpR
MSAEFLINPKAHIMVVDDDARLRRLLNRYLTESGYAVSVAEDASQAAHALSLMRPDVMILDVMMPGQSGLDFAEEYHRDYPESAVPILMLTALDSADDRIAGLESGVQDYLTKPFEPRELLLRIANILKRNEPAGSPSQTLQLGELHYDLSLARLSHQQEGLIELTTAERNLLGKLAETPNQPLSREVLAEALQVSDSSRHVDVQIGRLRKKLGDASLIQTVRGKGYQLAGQLL